MATKSALDERVLIGRSKSFVSEIPGSPLDKAKVDARRRGGVPEGGPRGRGSPRKEMTVVTTWHGEKLNCVCGRGRLDLMKTKKEDREKEKNLQKKLGDLQGQIQRLERRIALLKTENETLRQKQDDQRPLEEKIKSLKKRNAELASIARRLEEKAKMLQQENSKVKSKSAMGPVQEEGSVEAEQLKRAFSRQRAKDLAEHAKNMLAKDREIEELRKKCQELANQLSSGDLLLPQNAPQFEEKEELVNIIKQAAKERLMLEQQLAHSKTKERVGPEEEASVAVATKKDEAERASSDKYRQDLESANTILHGEIEKLEQALQRAGNLEQELQDKAGECSSLTSELSDTKEQKNVLEHQLSSARDINAQLDHEVNQLTEKVKAIGQITEECSGLKASLVTAQKEREAAQEEVKHLNLRVHSLENLVRDLQDSAEQVGNLENAHKLAVCQLQEKQVQIEQLQQLKSSEENEQSRAVVALNTHLKELEEKRVQEEEKREELSREVERLKEEAAERQKVLEAALREREELVLVKETAVVENSAPPQLTKKSVTPVQSHNKGGDEDDLGVINATKEDIRAEMEKARHRNQNDRPVESLLSLWAQKGPIQVYIAKYNYDPFEFSPNENPEAELPLTAGDYVLVVGEMDEDGFFDGELIDGRQGLVPSNFIEKVEDEDLVEFQAALMHAGRGNHHNGSKHNTSDVSPGPATSGGSYLNNNNHLHLKDSAHHKKDFENGKEAFEESNSDLEDIAEIDEDSVSVNSRVLANGSSNPRSLPSPKSISLDRQLSNSLLISWKGPEPTPGLEVESYNILVDGHLKTSIKSTERTKALLEGVDASHNHRVCIRCLSNRGQSKDAQCTMVIGKDVYPTPTDLKISHVSPTSASLSWFPGNSNYQHSINVNGKEVRVVKPGVFRHTLTGLTPGLLHKVTLIAKSISGVLNEEKSRKWVENVSASIEFTPPAAADHVVLSSEDFQGHVPSQLSVRTTSAAGVESVDSEVIRVPPALVKEMVHGSDHVTVKSASKTSAAAKHVRSPGSDEPKGHDTDEEIEAAFREAHGSSPGVNAQSASHFSDSSSSELSDIPEVEEDLIGSHDSRLNENEKMSPKPSPRQQDSGPKEFHSHKPAVDQGGHLAAPAMVVPAIEITRESSLERGSSYDDVSSSSNQRTSSSPGVKGPTPEASISSHYRGDVHNPSAFRQVDQSKNKDVNSNKTGKEPDALTDQKLSSTSETPRAGSRPSSRTMPSTAKSPEHRKHVAASSRSPRRAQEDLGDNDSISGEINPVVDESSVRLFIALFDYDPVTMSPNVDSIDEELPFREGQILKVFGDKDADGFYKGESQGRIGYIPCNMVSEVQIDDPELVEQLLKETAELPVNSQNGGDPSGPAPTTASDDQMTPNGVVSVPREGPVRKMVAMYDYDPQELSPNVDAEVELSFKTGDTVMIFGEMDEDGFFTGEIDGRHGLVPSNFLQPAPLSDDEGLESASVMSAARSSSKK